MKRRKPRRRERTTQRGDALVVVELEGYSTEVADDEEFKPTTVTIDFKTKEININIGSTLSFGFIIYYDADPKVAEKIDITDEMDKLLFTKIDPYMESLGWFYDDESSDSWLSNDESEGMWEAIYIPKRSGTYPTLPDKDTLENLVRGWGELLKSKVSFALGEVKPKTPAVAVKVYASPTYTYIPIFTTLQLVDIPWTKEMEEHTKGWEGWSYWSKFLLSYFALRGFTASEQEVVDTLIGIFLHEPSSVKITVIAPDGREFKFKGG